MSEETESIRNTSKLKTDWSMVYIAGGVSALILIVYSLVTMILLLMIGGVPETAQEVFDLLENDRIVGILRLDTLTLLVVPFYYPLFLSIFAGLWKKQSGTAALGALLALAGTTLFLATPSAFSMISLSDKYAAAATLSQQERLLAAGEALLASDLWHGSGAIIGGFLMLIAALILSGIMLKSSSFSKATAYVGLLTHGFDLAHSIVSIFSPATGIYFMMVAGPLYLVWFPLLARDLFGLARQRN